MRKLIKLITPPIIPILIRKVNSYFKRKKLVLFDGFDSKLFKEYTLNAKIYGEYGVGQSTRWVIENTEAKIISVESNKDYLDWLSSKLSDKKRSLFIWADIGTIFDGFGRPANYDKRDNFKFYFNAIWQQNLKPDVVLIDGRFRVACFFSSILNADPGTVIIFDDYTYRPYYHIVEEVIKPFELNDRQAFFKVPNSFDKNLTMEYLNDFKYVVD
jgi:hypothetical protein